MKFTLTVDTKFEQNICPVCGAIYALPAVMLKSKSEDGGDWCCPNGHSLVFTETKVDELRKVITNAKTEIEQCHKKHAKSQRDLRKAMRKIKELEKPKKQKGSNDGKK